MLFPNEGEGWHWEGKKAVVKVAYLRQLVDEAKATRKHIGQVIAETLAGLVETGEFAPLKKRPPQLIRLTRLHIMADDRFKRRKWILNAALEMFDDQTVKMRFEYYLAKVRALQEQLREAQDQLEEAVHEMVKAGAE